MGEALTDPETGRGFRLHLPDQAGNRRDLVLLLNLHGKGSFPRWQDDYFPACGEAEPRVARKACSNCGLGRLPRKNPTTFPSFP